MLGDRRIRALLILLWVPPMFVAAPGALAAAYADESGLGPAGVGLLMATLPVGTIAGELFAGSVLSSAARSRIVLPLAAGGPLPLPARPFAPGLGWILLALLLAGVSGHTPWAWTAGSWTPCPKDCAGGR